MNERHYNQCLNKEHFIILFRFLFLKNRKIYLLMITTINPDRPSIDGLFF